jgi:crossover junction endodeoxyribonuclease RuvC
MPIIIGIDPGLINCAWGIIKTENDNLQYIASDTIVTSSAAPMVDRLGKIYNALHKAIKAYSPIECAIEETFVNKNPMSSLKLGQARGVAILAANQLGIKVFEYSPRLIKKSLVGSGRADKHQVESMVKFLLPKADVKSNHESDALAVSICHANITATQNRINLSL